MASKSDPRQPPGKLRVPFRRVGVYLLIACLLLMLALEGVREANAFRQANREREMIQAQGALARLVEGWEDEIVTRAQGWLSEMETVETLRTRQSLVRDHNVWMEALYLWEPGEVLWPGSAVDEDIAGLRAHSCFGPWEALPPGTDALEVVAALRTCVDVAPLAVRAYASSLIAVIELDEDDIPAAEAVLRPLTQTTLAEAQHSGMAIRRALSLRLQYLEVIRRLDPVLADRMLPGLAREVAQLDGPSLASVLDLYTGALLPGLGLLPSEQEEAAMRATRRIAVWREVSGRSWESAGGGTGRSEMKLLVDPFGDPPYLLLYTRLGVGALFGGVQLDQPRLVSAFIERADSSLRPWISVRDTGGHLLVGDGSPLVVEIAFTRVLPHLRAGLSAAYLETQLADERRVILPLIPMFIGLVVGVLALAGLMRTDRQQMGLLEQQREFIARVTHELKTPLAGIRLMAENLEFGAFRDDKQRQLFAQRIIKETDRLHLRVDEVLRVATRPLEEEVQRADPTQLVTELADRWRPLFEQHKGELSVELEPIGPVIVKAGLLRDALYNLVDNALKYRDPARPARVVIRVTGERRWVVFEVTDNGLGVPANMRKAVFERFRRVEGPGRGTSGGHGLGLAFVADAARSLRGKVECREGVDGGASFVFRIPRRT